MAPSKNILGYFRCIGHQAQARIVGQVDIATVADIAFDGPPSLGASARTRNI
jgi:hypothetical protein